MKVIFEASDGKSAVQKALELKPDVVVMDISMPGMNGLVATRTLKERHPDAAIVTLTRHGDDAYLQELLRAGVSGYVLEAERARGAAPGHPRGRGRRPVPGLDADRAGHRWIPGERREASREVRRHHQPAGSGRAAADCLGLQQQGNRRAGSP